MKDPTDDLVECADCGILITDTDYEGKHYKAETIIASSQKGFGRPLCFDCAMKARAAG